MKNTKIYQAHVSEGISFFAENFQAKYGFQKYFDSRSPAVFFGIYSQSDWDLLANHKALAVVVFAGTDAMLIKQKVHLLKKPNIKIVSISPYIDQDLKSEGLEFTRVAISPNVYFPDPGRLGPCVYFYAPQGKELQYGLEIIRKVAFVQDNMIEFSYHGKKFRFPLIRAWAGLYSKDILEKIYRSCFVTLRLTLHDGLPNTVVEAAMMGVPSIYNGGLPGSYPWDPSDPSSILKCIVEASYYIGHKRLWIVHQMNEYVYSQVLSDKWTYEEFYQ